MPSPIKILVSGSNGQLGSELKELSFDYPSATFTFFSRDELSIIDKEALQTAFKVYGPHYFINCAAYTAVDKAEEEKSVAFQINGEAVGTIAELCSQYNCRLIHISTDYVFNGTGAKPLSETDNIDPVNAYGASKLMGEQLAFKNNPDSLIIRTSWVYSSYGKNFVKTMIRLMNEKQSISVVNDQIGSPTYAADLAQAILQIIFSNKWTPGIYNYSNDGVISWFDFANEIKKIVSSDCVVNPISTEKYPTPAQRPAYSVLDKSKIVDTYGLELKPWKESLKHCLQKLNS